jgi:SHS2 domain-containing protein
MPDKDIYEYINHTADLGVRVYGRTLEELFVNLGRAIFETQLDGELVIRKKIVIDIEGETIEDLAIDWCRELLYNFSMQGFIPKQYQVVIKNSSLKAELSGDIFDPRHHRIKLEIKNPTYHNLRVEEKQDRFQVSMIFDV